MIIENRLISVIDKIKIACNTVGRDPSQVRLIAVSKMKADGLIEACFQRGQLDFGENYVQELVAKSQRLPRTLRWHFIGRLQNYKKARELVGIENLHMVHTVHSVRAASELQKALLSADRRCALPLPVLVQVNTSREASKGGVSPEECMGVVNHVVEACPQLRFSGLMSIGEPSPQAGGGNRDFQTLVDLRDAIYTEFPRFSGETLELSMGMSHDYAEAIRYGSTIIRIGSEIFGERVLKK